METGSPRLDFVRDYFAFFIPSSLTSKVQRSAVFFDDYGSSLFDDYGSRTFDDYSSQPEIVTNLDF
jgi:hypothetical protein